jgi:hypothetical protein
MGGGQDLAAEIAIFSKHLIFSASRQQAPTFGDEGLSIAWRPTEDNAFPFKGLR